ncbi:MAG: hypothetical protein HQK55_01870 [Deltaproteobacteria bacterium]|nr:hypothetical protein [Deltaproteobacteria bacterium]
MKIKDLSYINSSIQNSASPRSQKSENDFAKALADAQNKISEQACQANQTGSLSGAAGLLETSPVGRMIAGSQISPQSQVNKALGVLDLYAQALADPNQNLKQISPLVNDLQNEAQNMDKLSQSLPEGHSLKPLAENLAVTATVEAFKYNRGDYV